MPTVQLSDVPEAGTDLEHFVAALFQAAGFFVEKNVIERDPSDVLELDLVATDYSSGAPIPILCEAKGGGWGWPDLFKVIGWMRYLRIDRGAFLVTSPGDKDIDKVEEKVADLGISLVHFEDFTNATELFESSGFGTIPTPELIGIWRFSYAIETKLIATVSQLAKGNPAQQAPQEVIGYHRLINDGVFFTGTVVGALHSLYDAYKSHPKITLASAVELDGGAYDPETPTVNNALLAEAMREGKHSLLQACMYVEQRARLAILKAAVDFILEYPDGVPPAEPGSIQWTQLLYDALPQTFKDGVAWLRQQPTFHRYALFWQQFLWGWGGFYLDDREETEHAWMSEYSGIPAGEVPTALMAFDQFFPIPEGWFVTPGPTCARRVRMVPAYFHGLGAHHRRQTYQLGNDLSGLQSSGYTAADLARWNNCTVAFLSN